jgi:drug/metabolite transporter (DMT)-like permease
MHAIGLPDGPIKNWALIIAPGLIWGCSFLFIAEALESVRPAGLTALRITIGFTVLGLFPNARQPVLKHDRPLIALLGVLWLAFPLSMFSLAEQHVSSAITGMLNGSTPVLVAVVGVAFTKRIPTRMAQLGLLIGLLGAVCIAWPQLHRTGPTNNALGVGQIALALVSYGFAINLARPLQQRNGALPVMWRALFVALIVTMPLGIDAIGDANWKWNSVLSLIALGSLGTGVANAIVATAAGRTNSTRAAVTTFIIPVVSMILGVVVRNDKVAVLAVAGCAICLTGAFIAARSLNDTVAAPTAARSQHSQG